MGMIALLTLALVACGGGADAPAAPAGRRGAPWASSQNPSENMPRGLRFSTAVHGNFSAILAKYSELAFLDFPGYS